MLGRRALRFGRGGRVALSGLVFTVVASVLTWRCHAYFTNPDLRAEDGSQVYAFFYANRDWQALFRFKAGYLPLIPNLLGFLAARLPPPAAPYFLTLVPALFTLAAFGVFNKAAFRRHVPSDVLRACCCLALAIAPLGTNFLVCHTDYSIWNLFLLELLLVMLPMPGSKWRAVGFSTLLIALLWSHPLSIVAAPATMVWLFIDKRALSRWLNALILSAQALHARFGVHPESATADAHGSGLSRYVLPIFRELPRHLVGVLSKQNFPVATGISPRLGQVCAAAFLALLLACAVLPQKGAASRACFAWVLYCIAAPLLLVMFARPEHIVDSSRYVYIARAFATIGACLLLWHCARWLLTPLLRFGIGQAFAAGAPAIAVLCYSAALNQPGTNDRYRQLNPDNGRIIHACFARLSRLQSQRGSPCHLFVPCQKKHGDWPFVIDSRKSCVE